MIRKQLYLDCVKALKAFDELDSDVYKSSHGAISLVEMDEVANLITKFTSLLEYCTKDESWSKLDDTNLGYFMYSTEYGKKADDYYITEMDGTKVYFRNEEDLWNYLKKNDPSIEDTVPKKEEEYSFELYSNPFDTEEYDDEDDISPEVLNSNADVIRDLINMIVNNGGQNR